MTLSPDIQQIANEIKYGTYRLEFVIKNGQVVEIRKAKESITKVK